MNVAFIPVRGGSKSIPLKNIKKICGRPLVYWTVRAACGCRYLDKVYIATDSSRIREVVEGFKTGPEADIFQKAQVIGRSGESATDTASTELAMAEFAKDYIFDTIVLIQATSPLLASDDLDKGFEAFAEEGTDSVLSVVPQKRFHWRKDEQGFAHPVNYDVFKRPRRQDFQGDYVENGAFYITSREALLTYGNRVSGNMKAVEMNEDTFFEIDEESDWAIIEALMRKNGFYEEPESVLEEVSDIKMFLTDCDGCLTDGGMYYSETGDEFKKFNARDGMGLALLQKKGIITGIVTSENRELNRRRAKKLNLDILEEGCLDKVAAIENYCRQYDIAFKNVAYIGDDINDLEVIKLAGFGCCPADAMPQVKAAAKYVTAARGGQGAVREAAELLLSRLGGE